MKYFTFFLVAVATMAGLVALMVPALRTRGCENRRDLRYRNPSRVPRLAVDFLGP